MSNPKSNIWTLKDVQRARQAAVYPRGFFIEYIVIGGGGAGGSAGDTSPSIDRAGGGGAGGFVTNEGSSTYSVDSGVTYGIIIGAGGSAPAATASSSGSNTIFNSGLQAPGLSVTAFGGGGGGGYGDTLSFGVAVCSAGDAGSNVRAGGDGASGGGGGTGWHWGVQGGRAIRATAPFLNVYRCECAGAQGYNGGDGGNYQNTGGGGGGGSSRAGCAWNAVIGPLSPYRSEWSHRGGAGQLGFNGIRYAGGGGGSTVRFGPGPTDYGPLVGSGCDGGGRGGYFCDGTPSSPLRLGCSGTAGTGGGGGGTGGNFQYGGGGTGPTAAGGSGGSGTVVIRYSETNPQAVFTSGNPTYAVSGGFRIYTFTSSGSIIW